MPILHKWNRIHRKNKAQRQQQEQQINDMKLTLTHDENKNDDDEKKIYVNGSPTMFVPNGGSNYNLQQHQPTSNGHIPISTPLLVSTSTNKTTDDDVEIKNSVEFDQRISSLETKVTDLSVSIDQTLSKMLYILQDMKKKDSRDEYEGDNDSNFSR